MFSECVEENNLLVRHQKSTKFVSISIFGRSPDLSGAELGELCHEESMEFLGLLYEFLVDNDLHLDKETALHLI